MKRKSLRKILSTTLAAIMTVGLCVGTQTKSYADAERGKQTTFSITKELQLGKGVTVPNAEFKFDFTPVGTASAPADDHPAIGTPGENKSTVTIPFTQDDTKNAVDCDGNYAKVVKVTTDLLANVQWAHAGQYKYTVTEQNGGETKNIDEGEKESIKYSDESYDLYINVKNGQNGLVVDNVFASNAGTEIEKENEGKIGDITTPSVPEGESTNDGIITGTDGNKFRFINIYKKIAGTGESIGNETVHNTLEISKNVVSSDDSKDFIDKNTQFSFTIRLNKVGALSSDQTYHYRKVNSDNTLSQEVPVTLGESLDFTLAHDERIIFTDVPVGTTYTVTENNPKGYAPSYETTQGNGDEPTKGSAEKGSSLSAENKLVTEIKESNKNATAFTNTLDANSITPTGIIINNLPFFLLIGGGIIAFAVTIANKRRRAVR